MGIALVRDDDLLVERAIRNVLDFCDEMFLVDHRSRDETPRILAELAETEPNVSFHQVRHPRESHDLVKGLAGSPTWVFGVDGDEIYDPRGLPAMRERLLAGEFDDSWFIKGIVLHCDGVEIERREATGWLAPPGRSITKLFNFAAIESWDGPTPERLHGGSPVFRPGYYWEKTRHLRDEHEWADSPFRCLHACFLRRSSRQPETLVARQSIADRQKIPLRTRLLARSGESDWKLTRYKQGPHVNVDAEGFFSS